MVKDKVAIVTGASSGIGAASARLLAQEGYRVALVARRQDRLQQLQEEILSRGGQAIAIPADLSLLGDIDSMVARVMHEFGAVDLLLNNAGFGRTKWLEDLDPQADIEMQIRVNLLGVIQTTHAVLPHMIERRRGHIINMGSQSSFIGTPTYSVYAASKFGLRGFSEALRREVGIYGIYVSMLYPAAVKTEFAEHMGAERKTGIQTPARLSLAPEDVARKVLQLAKRPRAGLLLPSYYRVVLWLNAALPGLVDWVIERTFTRRERER